MNLLTPVTSNHTINLSIEDGCLLRGSRVVVPPKLCSRVVDELHEGHPGIAKMKSLAHGGECMQITLVPFWDTCSLFSLMRTPSGWRYT